jgi:hypothetical protein
MGGQNLPIKIPPGIVSDLTPYAAKGMWRDGNLVRWSEEGTMMPVGGWVQIGEFAGATGPIRSAYSWRTNSFQAWGVTGSEDKAYSVVPGSGVANDITPPDLTFAPSDMEGYGSGQYGVGRYGIDSESSGGITSKFLEAFWTFHNWGEQLLGLHSIDGRLFIYDTSTATTPFAVVPNAPIGNFTMIVTNERHAMVMGGNGNPRRVKWCSREDINDWTPTATNSAGGFDLDTTGIILAAAHLPQGIAVFTDIDVHLIEYVGPPAFYSRRLISHETGIVGSKAFASMPNGIVFMGLHSFWALNAGIQRLPCPISNSVFRDSNLSKPLRVFMGTNEAAREIWTFYPASGSLEADRVAIYRFSDNDGTAWWSKGKLSRTAWLNPIWTENPYAFENQTSYQHEVGWTDNGAQRDIYAVTGVLEISNGDQNMFVDRIYQDAEVIADPNGQVFAPKPVPYTLEFEQAQAPQGGSWTTGPITLNAEYGFTTTRFKARQITMKVKEIVAEPWTLGDLRLRVKARGAR